MKKVIIAAAVVAVMLLSSCGTQPSVEYDTAPQACYHNPLTGMVTETDISALRPIAVMLNNIEVATPQVGIASADLLYECIVEGGITRFMAVFQSPNGVDTIGSIRSARTYYIELAMGLDAVYVHAGASNEGYQNIYNWGTTVINPSSGDIYDLVFWRDEERADNMGYEHSLMISGTKLCENYAGYVDRTQHAADYSYYQPFSPIVTLAGQAAGSVEIPFSYYKSTSFEYSESTGKYMASQFGGPLIDGADKSQLGFTNLIILKADYGFIDSTEKRTIELSKGDGWFCCGGSVVPIKWEKGGINDQLKYYSANGEPLTLKSGKSYIGIVPTDCEPVFK